MEHVRSFSRSRVRAAVFLTAGAVVLGGYAIQGRVQAAQYRYLLNKTYEHAFAELTAAVTQLDAALQKGSYAVSPRLSSALCSEIFRSALSAQSALGALPYGNVELEQTATFLARTGDYAMALSRTAVQGLTEEHRAALSDLSGQAAALSETLQSLESDLYAGTVRLEDLDAVRERLSQTAEDGTQTTAGSSFQTIESECSELPTLVYDGPFSDHIAGRTPRMLEGAAEVSRDEARARASEIFGLPPEVFDLRSEGAGRLPSYGFSAQAAGGELYVEMTRQGGQLLEILSSRPIGPAALSREEALAKAAAFLNRLGYPAMAETYFIDRGNILTVNFAALEGDVICYPDLVKVSVALDNGTIAGFESRGYLMNHGERDLAAPAVSLARAQAQVTEGLHILTHQTALIPTAGQDEILCHEFKCRSDDGRNCLLYVNGETGEQERILLLLEDENGTLVL